MKVKKNRLSVLLGLICILSCSALDASAQNATKILDTAVSNFKSAGGVKITYSYTGNGTSGNGTIKMNGQKFMNDMGDMVVWFNGKTVWTLVKSNEEVTITNPSSKEIAKMNPYAFVSLYKKGYKASMTHKSTHDDYEVLLTPSKKTATFKSILLRINRFSNQLSYVKMTSADGNSVEITVKTYAKNQKFTDATFTFSEKNYPDVDVIDLR